MLVEGERQAARLESLGMERYAEPLDVGRCERPRVVRHCLRTLPFVLHLHQMLAWHQHQLLLQLVI